MEEVVIGFIWGVFFATPAGWFLRSAAQWRREARRAGAPPVVQAVAAPPQPAQPIETRLERVLDRLNQRLETLEDRIDFTERLLDSRAGTRSDTVEPRIHPVRESSPR